MKGKMAAALTRGDNFFFCFQIRSKTRRNERRQSALVNERIQMLITGEVSYCDGLLRRQKGDFFSPLLLKKKKPMEKGKQKQKCRTFSFTKRQR